MDTLNITGEELTDLSVEDIAKLRVETDELLHEIDTLIDECNSELNS